MLKPVAGVCPLAYFAWKDRRPSSRTLVAASWIVWAASDAYVPVLIEDTTHASDMVILLLGGVFFGLEYHKSMDATMFNGALAVMCATCALPIHGKKNWFDLAWSCVVFVACASALWYAERKTELDARRLAAGTAWILFVQCYVPYVICQIAFSIYAARLAYVAHEFDEQKGAAVEAAPTRRAASHPVAKSEGGDKRRIPKPNVARPPLFQSTMKENDVIDPEVRAAPPFSFGKN